MSYSNPTFSLADLLPNNSLLGKCVSKFEGELDRFDKVIFKIFYYEVDVIFKDCVDLFPNNNLFSAHLLDILFLNGRLQDNEIMEQHLIDYSIKLLNSSWATESLSMYQIAFDYLIHCKGGIEIIESYLERFPLTYISELEAKKLFDIAFKYGLHDLAFSIGRVMQTRAFKQDLFGTSLGWNVRIKDPVFGTALSER